MAEPSKATMGSNLSSPTTAAAAAAAAADEGSTTAAEATRKIEGDNMALQLNSEVLLHIASYLTSKNNSCVDPLANFSVDDSDEEQPVSYSDIEAESGDDADGVDVDDGMAFDDYMERRWDRQGDRYFRQQDAVRRRRERSQRADERKEQLRLARSRAKEDARAVVAMAGVCHAWRREMCDEQPGEKSCDELLWRPLYKKMFHPSMTGLCDGNVLEKMGYSFFSMFQLMVKIENLQGDVKDPRLQATKNARTTLKKTNLEDIMFVFKFGYNGQYGKRCFMGIGRMNHEQVVDVKMPNFGSICEEKRLKWWKEAHSICNKRASTKKRKHDSLYGYCTYRGFDEHNDNDSDNSDERWEKKADDLIWTESSEKRSSFPSADIYAVLPPNCDACDSASSEKSEDSGSDNDDSDESSDEDNGDNADAACASNTFSVVKIYQGKPKWKRAETDGLEGYEFGPEICEEAIIAHLFGSKYLTADDTSVMVVHSEPNGAYSKEQEEWLKENYGEEEDYFSDEKMIELRKQDIMEFLLGSK